MCIVNYLTNRGKKIRIFLFGDYEFLGKAYGISGASGITVQHFGTSNK